MMVGAWSRVTVGVVLVAVCVVGGAACGKAKRAVRLPLTLEQGAPAQAVAVNEQGTQAFRANDFENAKALFGQAVATAPSSAEAHYNYGLALNALGETEAARKQFLDAADLAPGHKVIWDSPALAPYGDPETEEKKVAAPQNPNRRGGMGGRTP